MQNQPIKKLYYSIGEVSELTSLKQYVLRYWETEFADLKPAKNRAGNRIYRPKDIDLIFQIKKLLYEEKYTIEGARRKLAAMKKNEGEAEQKCVDYTKTEKLIKGLKKDLEDILKLL